MTTYWLSFVDPDKAEGTAFLGVCIIEAEDFHEAIQTAWDSGINPGGEVLGATLFPDDAAKLPIHYRDCLLDKDQADEANTLMFRTLQ